jgi:hypothetical protein
VAKKGWTRMTDEERERQHENDRRFREVLAQALVRDGVSPEEAYRRAGVPMPEQADS